MASPPSNIYKQLEKERKHKSDTDSQERSTDNKRELSSALGSDLNAQQGKKIMDQTSFDNVHCKINLAANIASKTINAVEFKTSSGDPDEGDGSSTGVRL